MVFGFHRSAEIGNATVGLWRLSGEGEALGLGGDTSGPFCCDEDIARTRFALEKFDVRGTVRWRIWMQLGSLLLEGSIQGTAESTDSKAGGCGSDSPLTKEEKVLAQLFVVAGQLRLNRRRERVVGKSKIARYWWT
jgi:hypothetical protein